MLNKRREQVGLGLGLSLAISIIMFRRACSISDYTTDTVIITGGWYAMSTVTRYDISGFLEDLPSLNEGRDNHGCAAFSREDSTLVFVTFEFLHF